MLKTCDLVVQVEGTGTIRFRQFVDDGNVERALGSCHTTFVLTTEDGRTAVVRERSLGRYEFQDGQIVLTTTSARATAFIGIIRSPGRGRLGQRPDPRNSPDRGCATTEHASAMGRPRSPSRWCTAFCALLGPRRAGKALGSSSSFWGVAAV